MATFLADDPILELEHYALKDRKLRMLAEWTTTLRERILDDATNLALAAQKEIDSADKEIKIHGKKVRARG